MKKSLENKEESVRNVQQRVSIEEVSYKTFHELIEALVSGNAKLQEELLSNPKNLELISAPKNILDQDLFDKVMNDIDLVRIIIKKAPALLNATTNSGSDAIHVSARQGNVEVVKLLIEADQAFMNSTMQHGVEALHLAASLGQVEVVKLLIETAPDLLNKTMQQGFNALHIAATLGHIDVMKLLIEANKALVNATTEHGAKAIKIAMMLGRFESVKLLIETAPDLLNNFDQNGRSTFYIIAEHGNLELVKWLISNHNLPSLADVVEPFFLACAKGGQSEMNKMLNLIDYLCSEVSTFKINAKYPDGLRLIDKISKLADKNDNDNVNYHKMAMHMVQMLRNSGSVEPEQPIGKMKLDLSDSRLDSYGPNIVNAPKLLKMLYEKYPLTEEEIMEAIENFKQKDLSGWNNSEWAAEPKTIIEIVDLLSGMTHIKDRLESSWSFKKVLASIITVAEADDTASIHLNLLNCLSQLKMCNLGKLMNLLYVVQDQLLHEAIITKEQEIAFYDLALNTLQLDLHFKDQPDKLAVSVKEWFYDILSKSEPEDWNYNVTKVQGILNQVFSMFETQAVRENSSNYHYLKDTILGVSLINDLAVNNENPTSWKALIQRGITLAVIEFFNELVTFPEKMTTLLDGLLYNMALAYGDFSCIKPDIFIEYYNKLKIVNQEIANEFLQLIFDNTTISNDTDQALKTIVQNAQNEMSNPGLNTDMSQGLENPHNLINTELTGEQDEGTLDMAAD